MILKFAKKGAEPRLFISYAKPDKLGTLKFSRTFEEGLDAATSLLQLDYKSLDVVLEGVFLSQHSELVDTLNKLVADIRENSNAPSN